MPVIAITIENRTPFADGHSFGDGGRYERIDATVHYAFDPESPKNRRIVDLERIPRDDDGLVTTSGNLVVIAPVEQPPSCLLVEVPNRGNSISARTLNRCRMEDAMRDPFSPGDGLLYRHGMAVAAIGWQSGLDTGLRLADRYPYDESDPLFGDVIHQFQPNRDVERLRIGPFGMAYNAPLFEGEAGIVGELYERANTNEPQRVVPRSMWEFTESATESRQHDGRLTMHGGFKAGHYYTLVYRTRCGPVAGLGLLALRDATSYLRYGEFPWLQGAPSHAVAYGASQSGRVLRHFLYEGLNSDDADRVVFDGLLPHIAGSQRGDFNHRNAQPSTLGVPGPGQTPPFRSRSTTDSVTGQHEGLLDRCNRLPKVVHTNTSWEYWRGDAALIHCSDDGSADVELLDNERAYLFAGTHHIGAMPPGLHELAVAGVTVTYPLNTIDFSVLVRAALINLVKWIREGTEPPSSRIPTVKDGTLVHREDVLQKFERCELVSDLLRQDSLPHVHSYEFGDEQLRGVCDFPAREGGHYAGMVADIGIDWNERCGIRLPEIALPLGIHTGWSPRSPEQGGAGLLQTFAGFSVFSAVPDSYRNRQDYMEAVQAVTADLIRERLVLDQDEQVVIANAMRSYDWVVKTFTATTPESNP